jgi:hypothetical protein
MVGYIIVVPNLETKKAEYLTKFELEHTSRDCDCSLTMHYELKDNIQLSRIYINVGDAIECARMLQILYPECYYQAYIY